MLLEKPDLTYDMFSEFIGQHELHEMEALTPGLLACSSRMQPTTKQTSSWSAS